LDTTTNADPLCRTGELEVLKRIGDDQGVIDVMKTKDASGNGAGTDGYARRSTNPFIS